jgi:hypothetical protein
MTQVATPAAAAAACAAGTASGGRAAMSPTPRLKTSRISPVESLPPCCRMRNSGGSAQLPASTVAAVSAGNIRARLPAIPPPVMCAIPCIRATTGMTLET